MSPNLSENSNNEHCPNSGNLQGSPTSLGKYLQCSVTFMWKIQFHYLPLIFSLLPPVTVSPLARRWTPGSRVGFPPSLTSQTRPLLLSALPGCPHTNPEHSSCGAWLTFSGGCLLLPCLPCGEEEMGTPGKLLPQKGLFPWPLKKYSSDGLLRIFCHFVFIYGFNKKSLIMMPFIICISI